MTYDGKELLAVSQLVADLREYKCNLRCGDGGLTDRAADEIERLVALLRNSGPELFEEER